MLAYIHISSQGALNFLHPFTILVMYLNLGVSEEILYHKIHGWKLEKV